MSSIPETLKRLRRERGLSQDRVGVDIGKSQASLSRYERGDISLEQLEEWAEYFDLEVTLVPTGRAEVLGLLTALLAATDESEVAQLLREFDSAPPWARRIALDVLKQARIEADHSKRSA